MKAACVSSVTEVALILSAWRAVEDLCGKCPSILTSEVTLAVHALLFESYTAVRSPSSFDVPLTNSYKSCSPYAGYSALVRYKRSNELLSAPKVQRQKYLGLLHPLPVPSQRWTSVTMDFLVELALCDNFDVIMVVIN